MQFAAFEEELALVGFQSHFLFPAAPFLSVYSEESTSPAATPHSISCLWVGMFVMGDYFLCISGVQLEGQWVTWWPPSSPFLLLLFFSAGDQT